MYNYFLQPTEPQYLEPFEAMNYNNANYTEAWTQDVPQNSSTIKNTSNFTQKNDPQINILPTVKEDNLNVLNANNGESYEEEVLQPYSCKSVALAAAKIVSETFPGAYHIPLDQIPDVNSEHLCVILAILLSLNKPRGRPRLVRNK